MPVRRVMRRRRKIAKGKSRRPGRYGRLRGIRSKMNSNAMDRATVVEAYEEAIGVTEGGSWISHQLSESPRALAVSKNFRFYRLKKVEVEFIPYANIFAGGTAFPELYLQVDRTQSIVGGGGISAPVPSKAIMLSRGVMPLKWTSPVRRAYSPSVLRNENFIQNVSGSVLSVASIASTPVKYKWYTTQSQFLGPTNNAASQVEPSWGPQYLKYFGMAYFVDQALAAPGAVLGTVKTKLHWEFRQPLVTAEPSSISDPLTTSAPLA